MKDRTIQFIGRQLGAHWRLVLLGTLLLVVVNAIGIVIPSIIKDTVDTLVANDLSLTDKTRESLLIVAGLALLMALTRTSSRVILFGVGRLIESEQKQQFYDHLLGLDTYYLSTQRIGDLISRATSDIQAIRQMMGFGMLNVINIVWVFGFTVPLMVSLDAGMTIWVFVAYLPVLVAVRFLSIKLKSQQKATQEELGNLSSFLEEDLNGIQIIKAYSQEEREISRFRQLNDDYLAISTELAQWRSLVWPAMQLARGMSFLVVLTYASQGLVQAGTLAAFLVALERIVFPATITGWLITIFQRGSVSVKRLNDVYDARPTIVERGTRELEVQEGRIEARDLTFRYNPDATKETPALQELSLTIPGGHFVGIVGYIGAGKSTFCHALLRMIDTPEASVYVDGQDVTNCTLSSLRREVAMVPQQTFLFNLSIRDNISFPGDYSLEEVQRVAKICQLHDEIVSWEDGYDTLVGQQGAALSGGQAQRVAIARTLLHHPKVLVLDDALSSVDNEVGLRILEGIRQEYRGQTLVLVTHRLSSVQDADTVCLFESGRCLASGSHRDLLECCQGYRVLLQEESFAAAN